MWVSAVPNHGGEVINRINIHPEIIKAVREAVGQDFLILVLLGASGCCEGGTTIDDSMVAARALEATGVDVLDVSGGFSGFPETSRAGIFRPSGRSLKAGGRHPGHFDRRHQGCQGCRSTAAGT